MWVNPATPLYSASSRRLLLPVPPSTFSLLSEALVCPPSPVRAFRGAEGTVQGAKGSLRVSRRPLPTPTPCEFCCKAPWHPCMGWVLGSSDCSYNWLAARGRLFKSACSTRARSLFGNFCRGVKRASKELQSCLGFFPFFVPFHYPPSSVCTLLRASRRTCGFRRGGGRVGDQRC